MYHKSKFVLFTLCLWLSCSLLSFAAEPEMPGVAPSDPQAGGARPGSVLLYNLYSSSGTEANHNTQISLTNTHATRGVVVHLFFVDGSTCAIADSFVCLTANQTASFLASDIDPGTTGYILAVANHRATGAPISFNFLIGSEYVKLPSGHAAKLPAESVAASYEGAFPLPTLTSAEAELKFNGRQYGRWPRVLALDEVGSWADRNHTLLVLNSPGGSMATGAAPFRGFFGILYDDAENAHSFVQPVGKCQFIVRSLDDGFPQTTPAFSQAISAGHTGWMRLWAAGERALTGAAIRLNRNADTAPRAFNGGANLHHLRLAEAATIVVPVLPPSC